MILKRFLLIFICLLLGLPFSVLASSFNVVLVTDICGLRDNGLNDSCWLGIQRAAKELGLKAKVIQSFKQDDYFLNLYGGASDGDIVVAVGFLMSEALLKAASLCPEKLFLLVDGKVDSRNVKSLLFKEEEIGFLAGLLASAVTKSNRVGYVGGVEASRNDKFLIGYRAGVKVYSHLLDKNIDVMEAYVGTFNDPDRGREIGKSLFSQGVDVVFQVAGQSGLGLLDVAKGEEGKLWIIGMDLDKALLSRDNVLTSIVRRVDLATYLAIIRLVKGNHDDKVYYMGLREGVLSIEETPALKKLLSSEVLSLIEGIKGKVLEGKIVVPSSREELINFSF